MQTNQIKSPTIYRVDKVCAGPKRQPQIPGIILKHENYWGKEIPIEHWKNRPILSKVPTGNSAGKGKCKECDVCYQKGNLGRVHSPLESEHSC